MKFRKSTVAAVIAAAAICLTTAAPVSAATVTPLPSAVQVTAEEDIPFLTTEEAEKYFRQQVKAHTEHIELVITDYEGEDYQDIEDRLNNALLEFTGDPTEGAYLALQSNKNDGTIYQVVEGICETDGFRKAADSSVYDKLLWAYDYLIDQMVLDSDLIDDSLSSAYSALIGRKANEAGQIHLLIRLMEELGVEPMIYMTNFNSLTNEEVDVHYLCMAKIDGTYYFLDPIWDKKMGGNAHRFFLRGYNDLDSESDGSEEFTHVHIFSILGIKPEDMSRLFKEFERLDEERNHSVKGTGLGLAITKQLLELMGSRLEVESIYDEGSNFHFTIMQKAVTDEKWERSRQTKAEKRSTWLMFLPLWHRTQVFLLLTIHL